MMLWLWLWQVQELQDRLVALGDEGAGVLSEGSSRVRTLEAEARVLTSTSGTVASHHCYVALCSYCLGVP